MKTETPLVPCIVIYTIINGIKYYISTSSICFTGKWLPHCAIDIKKAKVFLTEEEAVNFLRNIQQVYQRGWHLEYTKCREQDIQPIDLSKAEILK